MAGDWIKMEVATPDKPEVLAITARLGWDDPDLTVGKLFRIWRWFDQQTVDGNAPGVTNALLDRIVGVSGFADAMASVGWLSATTSGVSLPSFEKHCGRTAKDRAQTAKRVANHKSNAAGNGASVSSSVSVALPREDKREDKKKEARVRALPVLADRPEDVPEQVWNDFVSLRRTKRNPLTITALDGIRREARKAGQPLADALAICCRKGWQGFEASWITKDLQPESSSWAGAI